MKIQELHIQNYKSLVDLKIDNPNPFTVFAGSNGAGKSNIFEALEFFQFNVNNEPNESHKVFGGFNNILSRKAKDSFSEYTYGKSLEEQLNFEKIGFKLKYDIFESFLALIINKSYMSLDYVSKYNINSKQDIVGFKNDLKEKKYIDSIISDFERMINSSEKEAYKLLFFNFTRLFVNNSNFKNRILNDSDLNLSSDCSNLEKVLKRILKDENKREDICEWLDLLVPGFEKIEIVSEPLSGTNSLIIYEKGTKKPYNKNLLSDGTYNILALLTAVYQSDEPQFLCIEEPENGLNPKVQKELVNLFRQKCEEGHYIWINTHSQTIVNQLTNKELILVDKVDGATQIKQLTDFDNHGLPMDEAWLTNSLGGGIPW